MTTQRRLGWAAAVAFVIGVGLMIPFEAVATRIVGVAALFAYIVLGVFAIASPARLAAFHEQDAGKRAGEDARERAGEDARERPTSDVDDQPT